MADKLLETLTEYTSHHSINSAEAYATARLCLADTIGCAILALQFKECTKLLGPVVPGTTVPHGSRVIGTPYILDPIRAAFNLGTMIRWLDYNDTWLAAEWGHPSDNLGGILAVADFLSQKPNTTLTIRDVLTATIKAYEIQGVLALKNSLNRVGFDHVLFVKVATAAVTAHLLGLSKQQILNTISNAFIDAGPLRTYRHAPNTGSRKSWAAGDATSRGTMLAWMTMQGEMGYPQALTAKIWGFNDTIMKGNPLILERPLGSYVMENILFKVSFPAEFHAQTAVECAFKLYPQIKDKWDQIEKIEIDTHESALRIIDKKGPLKNPADRDHCLQYMVAIGLLHGKLTAEDYEEAVAQDPRIDQLRNKMILVEKRTFTEDYLHLDKRSIANAIKIVYSDGSSLGPVIVEYPLGHRKRRQEALPLIYEKCSNSLLTRFPQKKVDQILSLFQDPAKLDAMPVSTFIDLFI